mmetsp:Transcript_81175/g.233287  ORF Transcript_81175/g.233287 Transcript_81175/m.233287 type:complete len:279 (+) Transcript_81175:197-1033(+)
MGKYCPSCTASPCAASGRHHASVHTLPHICTSPAARSSKLPFACRQLRHAEGPPAWPRCPIVRREKVSSKPQCPQRCRRWKHLARLESPARLGWSCPAPDRSSLRHCQWGNRTEIRRPPSRHRTPSLRTQRKTEQPPPGSGYRASARQRAPWPSSPSLAAPPSAGTPACRRSASAEARPRQRHPAGPRRGGPSCEAGSNQRTTSAEPPWKGRWSKLWAESPATSDSPAGCQHAPPQRIARAPRRDCFEDLREAPPSGLVGHPVCRQARAKLWHGRTVL